MEIRYFFCVLIDHPVEPGKRIPPIASLSALDARSKLGEDVSGWLGIPDGVRRSLIKLDADTCIVQITAEAKDLDDIELSPNVKRIDLSKDVATQTKSTADLVKFGALPTDDAVTAIRKVCKSVSADLELFFDNQKDPTAETKIPGQKIIK